jgi:hypothetical protein
VLHFDPTAPADALLHSAPLWAPLSTLFVLALGWLRDKIGG